MCSVCLRSPCDSRCPNAPELEPKHICIRCEEGIYESDSFFQSEEGPICAECMHDMPKDDLLETIAGRDMDYKDILELFCENMKTA